MTEVSINQWGCLVGRKRRGKILTSKDAGNFIVVSMALVELMPYVLQKYALAESAFKQLVKDGNILMHAMEE